MSGPYRMVHAISSTADGGIATWIPKGDEMGEAGRRPGTVPRFLVLEAMAQSAGLLLNARHGERWLLAGIDHADVAEPAWNVPTTVRCSGGERRGRFARVHVEADHGAGGTSVADLRMAVLDRGGATG